MTLKERARHWLGLDAPPAPAPPRGSSGPPSHAAGTRARLTLDNPTISYLSGLTLLAQFDPERRWRGLSLDDQTLDKMATPQILELLCDLSPEISRGLWDFLRLANPGWEVKALTLSSSADTVDKRAQAAIDAFLLHLKERHGSFDVILNRLYIGAFMRGAFMAELVLDNTGRKPLDIAVPDAVWTYFRIFNDPQLGPIWEPYQFQQGRPVSLLVPTVRYVPVDPLPANPQGRPLASPAVFTALFALSLLHDLRRVVAQQGYPRLDLEVQLEELVKAMPPDKAADPDALSEWVNSVVADVGRMYASLSPDDAYTHTNVVKVNRPVGTVDSSSLGGVGPLFEMLERMLMRAIKSIPLLMGLTGSSNESQANRQWEVAAAGIKSLQHLCEGLLEHLFALALQAQGIQARVQFRFSELRAAELLRDAQVETLQAEVALFQYMAGWLSQDQACQKATGNPKADQPEPRAVPPGVSDTGSKITEPGQVQAEPGGNRQTMADVREALGLNGNSIGNGGHR